MSEGDSALLVIIAGGDTAEREGSLASARHLQGVLGDHYRTVLVELVGGRWTIIEARLGDHRPAGAIAFDGVPPLLTDLHSGDGLKPDAALISIHGRPGETGELQGYLDILGIGYNGPGVLGAALAADKSRCKSFLQARIDIRSPPCVCFAPGTLSREALEEAGVVPPFVIKPNDLGSAIGVFSVHSPDGVETAIDEARSMDCTMVVEPFVEGVELTVGAARFGQEPLTFEVAEVVRPSNPAAFRRYTSRKGTQLVIPARIPQAVVAELHRQTAAIGEALELRGVYRADFIWDGADIQFLEVNTLPGTSETSVLVQQARASGFPPETLFVRIAEDVLAGRAEQRQSSRA